MRFDAFKRLLQFISFLLKSCLCHPPPQKSQSLSQKYWSIRPSDLHAERALLYREMALPASQHKTLTNDRIKRGNGTEL